MRREAAMHRKKRIALFLALAAFIVLSPLSAEANSPIFSAATPSIAYLAVLYLVILVISPRRKSIRRQDVLFWFAFIFAAIFLTMGHVDFFVLWALYIGINFCLSLLNKKRLIYGSRQQDLFWYGAWTLVIIVSSIGAKISYYLPYGGWDAYIENLQDPYILFGIGMFAIPLIVLYVYARYLGRRKSQPQYSAAKPVDASAVNRGQP